MSNYKDNLNELLDKVERLGIRKQIDFEKLSLYSIITHSTAIEGSTISEIENQLMFDEQIVPSGKNVTEQMMNLDLRVAYEKAFSTFNKVQDITVDYLCQLSSYVMKNTGTIHKTLNGDYDSSKGELRKDNVSAGPGGRSYMSFIKVPERLQQFCEWLSTERKKDYSPEQRYYLSFLAHYKLVTIHPWVDGNGRMARLIMNCIQNEANLLPSIVFKESKIDYIKALSDSQLEDNPDIFTDYMMKELIRYIDKTICEFERSTEIDTDI